MIEVGEKIRCNDGLIGELVRVERDDIDISLKWYVFNDGKNERYVNKPYIVKHSKNIIDLIEVGDIVKLDDEFIEYRLINVFDESIIEGLKQDVKTGIKIKSILTKEQYMQNCYEIPE